jgi:hypothetical protein
MGLVEWYLDAKASASRDRLAKDRPERWGIPCWPSPEELWAWMAANMVYTGDGPRIQWAPALGRWIGIGFPDLYTHPEVLYAAICRGEAARVECDCDDYALFAYLALKDQPKANPGFPVHQVNIQTLVAGSPTWQAAPPWLYWPSHVVCTFERWDGSLQRYRLGVIDTNGLNWFDDLPQALVWFGKLYGTTYTAIYTPYPFDGGR